MTRTPYGSGYLVAMPPNSTHEETARGCVFADDCGLRYIPAQFAWFGTHWATRRWLDLMKSDCQIFTKSGKKYYRGAGYCVRSISAALDRIRHPIGSRRVRVDVGREEGLRLADAAEAAGLTITARRIRDALGIEKMNAVALRIST